MNTPNPTPSAAPSTTASTAPSTAPSTYQSARILLKDFQAKFAVFRDCLPLGIGIDKQLLAQLPELDRKVLRAALGIHTNSLRYLKVMEKATGRFDLEGNAAGDVTDVHRSHATTLLQERFKKEAEQRKAQRQAEKLQREAEKAQQAADEAARLRADKLNQLTAKFSRSGS